MVFDPNVFIEAIEDAAEASVKAGLAQITERAKHKAPVRRVFADSSARKIAFRGPVGVEPLQLNESRGPAFRYAERAGVSVGSLRSGRAFASPIFRSIAVSGRLAGDIKRNRDLERVVKVGPEERIPLRGRPNSRRPVVRVEGIGRVTGNFRELSEPGKLAVSQIYARVNGRTVRGDLRLTAKGRYELETGRAVTSEGELGGTLRDSIHPEGPFVTRGEVYGYVSAAAFNEKGFNYALAQEIGTGHNRPQPYLRPALRELRDQIVYLQRNAFSTALKNAGRNGVQRGHRGFRRVLKLEVDVVGFDRLDTGLGPEYRGGEA